MSGGAPHGACLRRAARWWGGVSLNTLLPRSTRSAASTALLHAAAHTFMVPLAHAPASVLLEHRCKGTMEAASGPKGAAGRGGFAPVHAAFSAQQQVKI